MSEFEIDGQTTFISNVIKEQLRVDVVLQATGLHGWNFSHGWVNVLKRECLLNRVFVPVADWEDKEPKNDDGLFEYLKNPQSDLILLVGFDWHSQPLHNTSKWQKQWQQAPIKKIALLQEHYSAQIVQMQPDWKQLFSKAIANTVACVDALICHHEPDVEFLKIRERVDKPIIFLPFAIDSQYFNADRNFHQRLNGAFFRGNASKHFTSSSYNQRRKLLEILSQDRQVTVLPLESSTLSSPIQAVQLYVDELRKHRILLNLPSLSPTLTSRPYEIIGCGGVLLQNRIIGEISNNLFKDWQHLVYYDADDGDDLISKLKYLIENPGVASEIASRGYNLCRKDHTLERRIKTIIDWVNSDFHSSFHSLDFKSILEPNPNKVIESNHAKISS
jgi:Glycosyl transferases group 1